MPFLSKMISFWNNLFRRRQVERDLNDELQTYVEEMAERKVQAGIPPEAAREAALLELGGMDRIKDLVRQQRVGFVNLRSAGVTVVVAIIAFVSGASAAAAAMRWSTWAPVPRPVAAMSKKVTPSSVPAPVLEGRIVDNATGQPLPFVEVGLRASPPSRRYTFADESGHFIFSNPPLQPYELEAGAERWRINQGETIAFATSCTATWDYGFEFLTPSMVTVKTKDGQPLEGERSEFHAVHNGTPYPPAGRELRRFRYRSSVVELRAENVAPGKVAKR